MATDGKKLNQLPELTTLSDATMLYAVDGGEDYHVDFETIKDETVPEVFTQTTDGLVPHPNSGNGGKVLRGDGTWQGTFDSSNDGLVPKLGTNDKDNVLRGDGTWVANDKLIGTGSGSLVTFDAIEAPMPKLKVSVEAKQDLHGYDHPWVGGAGKNKAESVIDNWSNKGITATRNDDGSYSITGTATDSVTSSFLINVYPVSDGEQYIVTNKKNQADTATKYTRCVCSFYNDTTYKSEINVSEGQTITVPSGVNRLRLSYVWNNGFVVPTGAIIYPMVRLSSEADATFAPYSNICPISGWDAANVSDVDDVDNPTVTQTTTITLPQTVYGGELDVVNGILKITDGYIASYNGETLPSTWISSMDVYAEGTSPTTGAEVCYELANPISTNLTPTLIKSLNGQNNLSVDCGDVIEVEYQRSITEAINALEAGGGYSETSLWSNSSGVYTGSLALSDSLENYNALMFKVSNAQGWANFAFIPTSALASNNAKAGIGGGMQSAVWWFQFTRTDATHITINNNSSTGDKLYQIVGVKY